MSAAKLDAIIRRARREAFPIVKAQIQAALPEGWDMVLAVGWGVVVRDEEGREVQSYDERMHRKTHGMSPHRMTAKLGRAKVTAEHLEELFWLENEVVKAARPPHRKVR